MKSVLILGAQSDIAISIATKFASEGYRIVLAGRSLKKLDVIKGDLVIKFGVDISTVFFNAEAFETHKSFVENLRECPEVTISVFGYLGDQKNAQIDLSECYKIISTNFIGAVSILNHVANLYEERNNGVIVGISSVAGDRGRQSNYIYGSSKAGFSCYLSGLRNRLAKKNVQVLTVKPGFVDTKMTENLDLPPLLTAKPQNVADSIFQAISRKKDEIYVLAIWRWVMLLIKSIPEFIFKKMNL